MPIPLSGGFHPGIPVLNEEKSFIARENEKVI